MAEQLHREIFEKLKKSVPKMHWRCWASEESGATLITASFVANQFDGTKEEYTAAHLSISKQGDDRWHYSAGFMQSVDQFSTHETAIPWLLSKFRQFAVEETES